MKPGLISILILVHFVILVIAGFCLYDSTYLFYGSVQLSTIIIYIVSKQDLSKRNKVLIDGLILMTALETLDYIWMTNTNYLTSSLSMDGIIVLITTIITAIRYFKNGKAVR